MNQTEGTQNNYYNGTQLLSYTDIDGSKPEIYICTTNRTGGKTTWFGKKCVDIYLKSNSKFGLLYRYKHELDNCAEKFFKDLGNLFFPNLTMESVSRAGGCFHELFLNGESCGYVFALNSADQLKKYSHFFSDCDRLIFDEFQLENGNYCSGEIFKFISLHQSIARGNGKQSRYVPVYMLGNTVSLVNPYFTELGISERLREDTKFLRGKGWVLEQGYVNSAANAQNESAFNRAFSNNKYVAYSSQNVYLNDNLAFIEKPEGKSRYLCTLKYKGVDYGVREYIECGLIYCDKRPDLSNPFKISVTTSDHQINYVMLHGNLIVDRMKYFFNQGCFRFKDLECKECIMKAVST